MQERGASPYPYPYPYPYPKERGRGMIREGWNSNIQTPIVLRRLRSANCYSVNQHI